MTVLDLLLLLVLGVGAVKGFRRGLVLEVASLLAFVLAVVGGLSLLAATVPVVRHYVGEAYGLLPTALHLTPLGILDSLLGGAAGLLKWLLGLSLLLHGTGLAGWPLLSPKLAAGSQVLPLVRQATPLALHVTAYVLPVAQGLLVRMKAAFVKN